MGKMEAAGGVVGHSGLPGRTSRAEGANSGAVIIR